jgi:translation initiation factor IF-2
MLLVKAVCSTGKKEGGRCFMGCVTVTVIVDVTPQVKAVFGTGKKRVAGCEVTTGKLSKGAMIEVVRGSGKDKTVVFTGKLASLRRIKDTVNEVRSGCLSCCFVSAIHCTSGPV